LIKLCAASGFLAMIGGMSGCYTEGGVAYSLDRYSYVSRPWQPLTVSLKDTRTGQDFWSVDVPVGKMLIVSFSDTGGTNDAYTPSLMTWGFEDESFEYGVPTQGNSLPVPPVTARRLDVAIRTTPELPESMVTATKGTARPARVPQQAEPAMRTPSEPSRVLEPINAPVAPSAPAPTPAPSQPGVVIPPPMPAQPATPATPPKAEPPIDLPSGR
jgi:hypothetical protein